MKINFLFILLNMLRNVRCIKNIKVSWSYDGFSNTNYYVQLTGKQAHSWNDAFNRCARIINGDAFPAIFRVEKFMTAYLNRKFREFNLDPGKT